MEEIRPRTVIFTLKDQNNCYKRLAVGAIVWSNGERYLRKWGLTALPIEIQKEVGKGWQLLKYRAESLPGEKVVAGGEKPSVKPKKERKKEKKIATNKKSQIEKWKKRFSPLKFDATKKVDTDTKEIADLLNKIVAGAVEKSTIRSKYSVDVKGLLMSFDKGENPIDYLCKPIEQERKPSILLTPDFSGSCNADADLFRAIGNQLSKDKSITVQVVDNCNGQFNSYSMGSLKDQYDLVLYIGDSDFFGEMDSEEHVVNVKAKKRIVLNNHACNVATDLKVVKTKDYVHISHVSYKGKKDILNALKLV